MPPATFVPTLDPDWTVWAFSDAHGVVTGLRAAFEAAGLVDHELRWVAPPKTALVGCGDYIDRGTDSPGVIDLLRAVERNAAAAGGRAIYCRGNHEQIVLKLSRGEFDLLPNWLEYGGQAMLASYGFGPGSVAELPEFFQRLERRSAGTLDWLDSLAEAVRWRDVLFVHGGLPPGADPDDLGRTTDRHLWVRTEFFDTPWESGAFRGFEQAGIERVVFGHTPLPHGARLYHEGRSIDIDTNASGNPRLPADAEHIVTLVRLAGDGNLRSAPRIVVHTEHAPDRAEFGLAVRSVILPA